MHFTNITALFLGSLHPGDQSYCSFGRISSELQFEAEADVPDLSEDTEWDDSGIDRFLSRRSEQITLSEQCVEDDSKERNFTESEQEEVDALKETMEMKGCKMTAFPSSYSIDVTIDNSNCSDEVTRYRAVCDADDSYQLVEWRAYKSICTGFAPVDNTGALQEIIYNFHFQNATRCISKSCPSDGNDWTAADTEFILEQDLLTCGCGFVNASCALEYLEDPVRCENDKKIKFIVGNKKKEKKCKNLKVSQCDKEYETKSGSEEKPKDFCFKLCDPNCLDPVDPCVEDKKKKYKFKVDGKTKKLNCQKIKKKKKLCGTKLKNKDTLGKDVCPKSCKVENCE